MTKELFTSILSECGYPENAIEALWDMCPIPHNEIHEHNLRLTAQDMVAESKVDMAALGPGTFHHKWLYGYTGPWRPVKCPPTDKVSEGE